MPAHSAACWLKRRVLPLTMQSAPDVMAAARIGASLASMQWVTALTVSLEGDGAASKGVSAMIDRSLAVTSGRFFSRFRATSSRTRVDTTTAMRPATWKSRSTPGGESSRDSAENRTFASKNGRGLFPTNGIYDAVPRGFVVLILGTLPRLCPTQRTTLESLGALLLIESHRF